MSAAGILVEARLLPAPAAELVETPLRRRSLMGRVLGTLRRIVRPGAGCGPEGAVTGKSG